MLGHRLVAFAGNALHPSGLAFHLGDGLADPLDQFANLRHGGIEHLAQLAQLVAAADLKTHGQIAVGNLAHDFPRLRSDARVEA